MTRPPIPAGACRYALSSRALAASLVGAALVCACLEASGDSAGDTDTVATAGTSSGPTTGISTEAGPDTEPTGAFPGCDGVELVQDGALDLDIPAVKYVIVDGAVRVNGAPLPDAALRRSQGEVRP